MYSRLNHPLTLRARSESSDESKDDEEENEGSQ